MSCVPRVHGAMSNHLWMKVYSLVRRGDDAAHRTFHFRVGVLGSWL